jgi:hypothetical protein
MRLCAIYNVWADSLDLLPYSIENILPVVDGVIVVWSESSNKGIKSSKCLEFISQPHNHKIIFHQCEPSRILTSHQNETLKRQYGLDLARDKGFTHFIMMDSDEFYKHEDVEFAKRHLIEKNLLGIVCRSQVYFKSPCLTVGLDHTLVPFIHTITPSLKLGNYPEYPFAYDEKGNAHIDPTRRLNVSTGVELLDIVMHHYSWIRSDYELKIENSSASNNLKRSSIYDDLKEATDGHYNQFYRSHLTRCDNIFNLPEL